MLWNEASATLWPPMAPAVLLQVRPCAPVVGEASPTLLGIPPKIAVYNEV